jgi:hypothetical protein
MSMLDYLATGYGCEFRAEGGESLPRPGKPRLGDYDAQAHTLKMIAGEPAALGLLWGAKEELGRAVPALY